MTSTEVARHAGVSQATVSLALSEKSGSRVSDATRQRVRDAAAHLGYSPSRSARALRTGRTDSVIVLTPQHSGAIGYLAIGDLVDKIGATGLELVIHRLRPGESLASIWEGQVPTAIIGSQLPTRAELDEMRSIGITPLFLDMVSVSARIGRMQVQHLVEQGRGTVAFVGPAEARDHPFVTARIDSASAACGEFGIDALIVEDIALDHDPAAETVAALRDAGVSGVAAYNDDHAFAVLSGARTLDIRVPDQLAVIGCDDVPLGKVADPPLSTVKVGASGLADGVSELRMRQPLAELDAELILVRRAST